MRLGRARFLLSFALMFAGATLSGCCRAVLCDSCQPSGIYVSVTDAWTKMVLTEVTVSVQGKPCVLVTSAEQRVFLCSVPAGQHTLDLQATNYNPQQVMLTLQEESAESCCPCGPIGYGTAELTPLDGMQSM